MRCRARVGTSSDWQSIAGSKAPRAGARFGVIGKRMGRTTLTLDADVADRGASRLEAASAGAGPRGATAEHVAAALLRIHATRDALAERHRAAAKRLSDAHPGVPVAQVPAAATDVHDLDGLRTIGAELAGWARA